MSRHQPVVTCSESDMATLTTWSTSRTSEARMVERARIILRCIHGDPVQNIARDLGIRPNTVIDWRRRFVAEGIAGLFDRDRLENLGSIRSIFVVKYLQCLTCCPEGQATWDGKAVAAHLNASPDAVWRVLRKEGIDSATEVGASALIPSLPQRRPILSDSI